MRKFAIVAKKNQKSQNLEAVIKKELCAHGWLYDKQKPELVICVGGDGTLLYAVHKYLDSLHAIRFLGIHTGTLGFFTDYTEDEAEACIYDILHKEPQEFKSSLLEINVIGNNPKVVYALNEVRIENIIRTQQLDIYVDGEFFETCRGSGICLSTQAGSTAYNRSLKGAVIDSGLSLMQLAEVTAIQHSKHRSLGNPYILKDDRKVEICSDDFSDTMMCYDHLFMPISGYEKLCCTMSDRSVRFARYRSYSYLKRLKNLY